MSENTGANDTSTDSEGLVTGANHGRGAEGGGATNPEEFASGESDLALSNQVDERESDGDQND